MHIRHFSACAFSQMSHSEKYPDLPDALTLPRFPGLLSGMKSGEIRLCAGDCAKCRAEYENKFPNRRSADVAYKNPPGF